MDFMKVFDQTVREIKREVNLKVLKVPEIEQKVLDATEDEPWGPHGTVLAEIAQATKKFSDCGIIMNVLWTRLTETGKNWRLVYKSLAVIEYLVAHGSDQAVDDIVEHTFRISSLTSFEYVEPSGKDVGINVRKKAENIMSLLNNKDKIQEVRNKALANREKYVGVSSSGITYKSGADSFSSNFKNNDRYRGFGSTGDNETFKDSYSDKDRYGDDKYEKDNGPKKESRYGSIDEEYPATSARKTSPSSDSYNSLTSQIPPSDSNDEDFDDFDPRGTSSSKTSTKAEQVDLFGQNFVGDLLDASVSSVPTDKSSSFNDNASEVDLFADANFVSATPEVAAVDKNPQHKVDLFASNNSPSPVISTTMDFFAMPDQTPQNDKKDVTSNVVDPFASVPLNTFDGSDPFGAFVSHTNNASNDGSQGNKMIPSLMETKSPQKKSDAFQIKSGIWADSLSRGIIDLNITAPKKVNLADVGIVGGFEENEKRALPSFYMGGGSTIADGYSQSRVGNYSSPIINDDDFFSSLSTQQNQLNNFQK